MISNILEAEAEAEGTFKARISRGAWQPSKKPSTEKSGRRKGEGRKRGRKEHYKEKC